MTEITSIAIGTEALRHASTGSNDNVAIAMELMSSAHVTGSYNIGIGGIWINKILLRCR